MYGLQYVSNSYTETKFGGGGVRRRSLISKIEILFGRVILRKEGMCRSGEDDFGAPDFQKAGESQRGGGDF